jgi:hypothetical protein
MMIVTAETAKCKTPSIKFWTGGLGSAVGGFRLAYPFFLPTVLPHSGRRYGQRPTCHVGFEEDANVVT